MSFGCWLCGTVNDCNCPTPEEVEKRRRLLEQNRRQAEHEASVRRQKSKLKVAPWRTDTNRPDFQN